MGGRRNFVTTPVQHFNAGAVITLTCHFIVAVCFGDGWWIALAAIFLCVFMFVVAPILYKWWG